MKRLIQFLFAFLAATLDAQTAKTRADLYTEINTSLASGQQITATTLRGVFKNVVASAQNGLTDGTAVVTTGSYADPLWLTGLSWTKISSVPTSLSLLGITNGAALDTIGANGGSYYLSRANHSGTQLAATISDFAATASAAAPVQSVAGKTGAVTLTSSDVGLGSVENTALSTWAGTSNITTVGTLSSVVISGNSTLSVTGTSNNTTASGTNVPVYISGTATTPGDASMAVNIVMSDTAGTSVNGVRGMQVVTTSNRSSSGPRAGFGIAGSFKLETALAASAPGGFYGTGGSITANQTSGATTASTHFSGVQASILHAATVPLNNLQGVRVIMPSSYGSGALTDVSGIAISNTTSTSGSITNTHGILIGNMTGGNVTNAYGIKVQDVSGASGTNYSIFTGAGTARFGGLVVAGSGNTTLTDSTGKLLSAALNTVAVANGGTGATDAATARTNLGVEPALGNPASDGYVLSSTAAGVRSWVAAGAGSATWGSITGTLSSQTDLNSALSGKEPTITAGTTGQYWRGDKSWQTLDKSAVGLGTVENTALSTWAGTANVTTLGNVTTGTWSAGVVAGAYGGTGVANTGKTITLGGNFTISGAYASTLTLGGITSVTLPTSGTLATLAGTEALTGKTYNGLTVSTTNGTLTIPNSATLATAGAYVTTLTSTANTSVTLPTTGTLATLAGSESLTNKKLGSLTSNGVVTTSGGDGTLSVATVAVANGGTGQTTYTNGQILIGNTTSGGLDKATLTAGNNITITNAAGAITINATASGGGAEKWDATFDGQGQVISANVTVYRAVVTTGNITAGVLVADASGNATVSVTRHTPSAGALGAGTALGNLTLSSAVHSRDTTLSGWTKSVTAGDVLAIKTESATAAKRLTVNLTQ